MTLTLTFQCHSRSSGAITPHIWLPLMFNNSISPNSPPLQDIRLRNLSDLAFGLSRSPKVKCDGGTRLPIYGFLLKLNSNLWPKFSPLQEIRIQNLSDLEFDILRSLKVKSNGLTI